MKKKNYFNKTVIVILIYSLLHPGCYVGSTTNIRADHSRYPVSFTDTLHDAEYFILTADHYTVLHNFRFDFHSWGGGIWNSEVTQKDISDRINSLIEQYDGDGIVNLQIAVANSWMNGITLLFRSFGFLGVLGGIGLMIDWNQYKIASVGIFLVSLFAFLSAPGVARIRVSGSVIRINDEYRHVQSGT